MLVYVHVFYLMYIDIIDCNVNYSPKEKYKTMCNICAMALATGGVMAS